MTQPSATAIKGLVFNVLNPVDQVRKSTISYSNCGRYVCTTKNTTAVISDMELKTKTLTLVSSDADGDVVATSWVENNTLDGYKDVSIITIHTNGVIILWDLSTAMPRQKIVVRTVSFTDITSFKNVMVDEDGDEEVQLMYHFTDSEGNVRSFNYDQEERELVQFRTKVQKSTTGLTCIAAMSSNLLTMGTKDGRVIVADTKLGEIDTVSINSSQIITHITHCTFGEDRVIVCGDDAGGISTIKYNIKTGSLVFDQSITNSDINDKTGLRGACGALWYCKTMKMLVAGSSDGTLRIFEHTVPDTKDHEAGAWELVGSPIIPVQSAIHAISGHELSDTVCSLLVIGENERIVNLKLLGDGLDRKYREHLNEQLFAEVGSVGSAGCAALVSTQRNAYVADKSGLKVLNFPLIKPRISETNSEEDQTFEGNVRYVCPEVASVLMFELDSATTIPETTGHAEFLPKEVSPSVTRPYPMSNTAKYQAECVTCTPDGSTVATGSRQGGLKIIECRYEESANKKRRLQDFSYPKMSDYLSKCAIFDIAFLKDDKFEKHPVLLVSLMGPSGAYEGLHGEISMPSKAVGFALVEAQTYNVWRLSSFVATAVPVDKLSYQLEHTAKEIVMHVSGISHTTGWQHAVPIKVPVQLEAAKFAFESSGGVITGTKCTAVKFTTPSFTMRPIATKWLSNVELLVVDVFGATHRLLLNGADSWTTSKYFTATETNRYCSAQFGSSPDTNLCVFLVKADGSVWRTTKEELIQVSGQGHAVRSIMPLLDGTKLLPVWAEILVGKDQLLREDDELTNQVTSYNSVIAFGSRLAECGDTVSAAHSLTDEHDRLVVSNDRKKKAGRTLSMNDFFKREASSNKKRRFGRA